LGWQLLPYASLPAPIDGSTLRFVDFLHGGRNVRLVSGLQAASDVMRGEETELIGLFADPVRHHLWEHCTVVRLAAIPSTCDCTPVRSWILPLL